MPATCVSKRRRSFGRALLLGLLLLVAAALILEKNLSQTMLDLAYADAYSRAVETVNQAVSDVTKSGVAYDQLMTTRMDGQGRVSMMQANTAAMNELATKTALLAQQRLNEADNQYVYIPLGSALGLRSLAGTGPRVPVRIVPVGSVGTQFTTEFQSAGINQTRHRIVLNIKATVRLVIPTGSQRVDVVSTVPIAESIIVGQVPSSFVDVANQDDMLNLIP